jgi:DNA-binding CsgD family transcriptional regulator
MAETRALQAAFVTSVVPMAIVNDDRRYVDANRAACEHLGMPLDKLLGRRVDDDVDADGRDELSGVAPGRHLYAWLPEGVRLDGDDGVPISDREREVLRLVARGDTVEDIATRLVISPNTVRTHIRNARLKLGAGSRAHAIALALTSGLLNPPF